MRFQGRHLARVVCHQPNRLHPTQVQNLGGHIKVAHVSRKAQPVIRLDRVQSFVVLQLIGSNLGEQTNASTFLAKINHHAAAFLTHAALEAGDNQAQAGQDAIQLMTVHSAKGLEFDAVFITGLEEGLFPHENSLSDGDGLEEERRLMYVAITRARQRLYISFSQTRMLHGQTRYNVKSRFLDELPESALKWLTPRTQGFGSGFARDYQAAWQRGSGLGSMVGAGRRSTGSSRTRVGRMSGKRAVAWA